MRSLFYTQALDAVHRVPGVNAAAFTSLLPLSGDIDVYGVHFEADRDPNEQPAPRGAPLEQARGHRDEPVGHAALPRGR